MIRKDTREKLILLSLKKSFFSKEQAIKFNGFSCENKI